MWKVAERFPSLVLIVHILLLIFFFFCNEGNEKKITQDLISERAYMCLGGLVIY